MPETRGAAPGVGGFIRSSGYVRKWMILGPVMGVVAGLGAVTFYLALDYAGRFLLGYLGGYHIPKPIGDGGDPGSAGFDRPWAIPLVVCAGALVSAWLVAKFAPEAEGHGTDAAIEAVHTNPRAVRARAIVVKTISSALTIGAGGSAGREGPAAQISAGIGSLLTKWLNLSDDDGRILVSLGIGSGIGAIFGAPLGGAVLAASILYRRDFEYKVLIPGFITSAVAFGVFGSILGFDPLFGYVADDHRFSHPLELGWFVVLGAVAALFGYLYARIFYGTVALTERLPGGKVIKPALGGLAVGLLALLLPPVLASGYGWAQKATAADTLMQIPLWMVLILPLAKIVATSLSIGTGGSGGIFGPGVVIGAFVGAAVWRLGEVFHLPGIPDTPGVFVVVGMMACFGGVAHAPLAVMIMVAEMTGSFTVVPCALVAVGVSYLLINLTDATMYRAQRLDRESAAAERTN